MAQLVDLLRRRLLRTFLLLAAAFIFIGAGDEPRFRDLGHRLMCVCGCNQILLECNHVGCQYSDRMRGELMTGLLRGENDDLTLQSFVQKYGPTVLAAPTNSGFNQVAWITPYLVLVLATTIAVLTVRSWRMSPTPVSAGRVAAGKGPTLDHFIEQARKDTEL